MLQFWDQISSTHPLLSFKISLPHSLSFLLLAPFLALPFFFSFLSLSCHFQRILFKFSGCLLVLHRVINDLLFCCLSKNFFNLIWIPFRPPLFLSLLFSSLLSYFSSKPSYSELYRSNVNYATPTRHWMHPSSPALQLPTLQCYIKPTVWDHSPIWFPFTVSESPQPCSCFTCYQLSHSCSTAQCCLQLCCHCSSSTTIIVFNLIVLLRRRQSISGAGRVSYELHSCVTNLQWLMFWRRHNAACIILCTIQTYVHWQRFCSSALNSLMVLHHLRKVVGRRSGVYDHTPALINISAAFQPLSKVYFQSTF